MQFRAVGSIHFVRMDFSPFNEITSQLWRAVGSEHFRLNQQKCTAYHTVFQTFPIANDRMRKRHILPAIQIIFLRVDRH